VLTNVAEYSVPDLSQPLYDGFGPYATACGVQYGSGWVHLSQ
jgi:hypothetical protein